MKSEICQTLSDRINDLLVEGRVGSEMDFVDVVGLSARLSALGDSACLQNWQNLFQASTLTSSLEDLFRHRSQAGVFDLHELLGEELALAIIEAQDASCFMQIEEQHLSSDVTQSIRNWADEADIVSLDTEAASFLRDWLVVYPLPEHLRLRPLIAPKSKAEWRMLGMYSKNVKKSVVLSRDGKLSTVDGDIFLSENKMGTCREVRMMDQAGQPIFIRHLRAEFLPAVQKIPGTWVLHLEGFSSQTRDDLLHAPLELTLLRGQKLTIRFPDQIPGVRNQYEMTWNTHYTITPMTLLACDDGCPSDTLKKLIDTRNNDVQTAQGVVRIGRFLDDAWNLHVFVSGDGQKTIAIAHIHLDTMPFVQDEEPPIYWSLSLKHCPDARRRHLLEQPLVIHLESGECIRCIPCNIPRTVE